MSSLSLPENREETITFLKHYGALELGHFLLASGRHSGHYVKKNLLIQWPHVVQSLIESQRAAFEALGKIDVVLSPAIGGIPVGQQVGLALEARTIYAERDVENRMALKRGFQIKPGERVLLVEDVITTGGTLVEIEKFVHEQQAEVAGVFVVVNRSALRDWNGKPLVASLTIDFPTYAPDEVPEELQAIPLVRPGTKRIG